MTDERKRKVRAAEEERAHGMRLMVELFKNIIFDEAESIRRTAMRYQTSVEEVQKAVCSTKVREFRKIST